MNKQYPYKHYLHILYEYNNILYKFIRKINKFLYE